MIARGRGKAACAQELGAHHYIDDQSDDPVKRLQTLGEAKPILTTLTNSDAMTAVIGGLGRRGTLIIAGISREPVCMTPAQLITHGQSIIGFACGTATDSEHTTRFAAVAAVLPMVERFPLDRVAEAFNSTLSGEARLRVVLETGA